MRALIFAAALALLSAGPVVAGGDEHDSLASGGHASYGGRSSSGGGGVSARSREMASWYTRWFGSGTWGSDYYSSTDSRNVRGPGGLGFAAQMRDKGGWW